MLDALPQSSEPRTEKVSTDLHSAVSAEEARNAIRKAFPCEGDLRIHHLWSTDGGSRFRANWFGERDGKTVIIRSLVLGIKRTADGLVVQDNTVVR